MSEINWRRSDESPNYEWAITKWELLHTINGKSHDVTEEWGVEMGTPEKLRAAIKDVGGDMDDDGTLMKQLLADLDALIADG